MTSLKRVLGFGDMTLLTIGCVIGSGIFLVPGEVMLHTNGTVGPALLVWLVGGILSLLGALTYGELSSVNPKAGGLYVYIRDCFGPLPAFLFGWTLFFAMNAGAVATLAVAFGTTLGQLIPFFAPLSKITAIAMILVLTAVNIKGTRTSADLQNWTTGIKVAAILLMSAVLLSMGRGLSAIDGSLWPEQMSRSLLSGCGLAMIGVLWAYEGWQYGTFSAGEVTNPQKTLPRAFLIGTASLVAIYLLANLSYVAALSPQEIVQAAQSAESRNIAVQALTAVVNPTAARLISVTILVSVFSAANSNVLTCPRVYYAMANDGLFFKKLAEVHPRFGTPAFAIVAGSVWSVVLAAAGTFSELLTYVVFSGWIFYGLAAATIFVYRRKSTEAARAYSVPGYPWTPLLFIGAACVLVANTLWTQLIQYPIKTLMALGIIILGLPAYYIWRSRNSLVIERSLAPEETELP
jgi:basic amino acid/polyamine antiporter, APA family